MRFPLRMYSDKGGWTHVYNPGDQAHHESLGWIVDDPSQQPAAVPDVAPVEAAIPIRRGPGRPRKIQPDAIPESVDVGNDDAIDSAQEM